jgi:hypothetical protein
MEASEAVIQTIHQDGKAIKIDPFEKIAKLEAEVKHLKTVIHLLQKKFG